MMFSVSFRRKTDADEKELSLSRMIIIARTRRRIFRPLQCLRTFTDLSPVFICRMRQPLDLKVLNTVAARCFLPPLCLDTLRIFLYNAFRVKLFSAAGSGKVNGEAGMHNSECLGGAGGENAIWQT